MKKRIADLHPVCMTWKVVLYLILALGVALFQNGCGKKLSRGKAEGLLRSALEKEPPCTRFQWPEKKLVQASNDGHLGVILGDPALTASGAKLFSGLKINNRQVEAGGFPYNTNLVGDGYVINITPGLARKLDEVTGIVVVDGAGAGSSGTAMAVEYSFSYRLSPEYGALAAYLVFSRKTNALFRLYDDGWRIEELGLEGEPRLTSMASGKAAKSETEGGSSMAVGQPPSEPSTPKPPAREVPKPTNAEIQKGLAALLPAYLDVSEVKIDNQQNLGDDFHPEWASRFEATTSFKVDTFVKDVKEEGITFLKPVKRAGESASLFGKCRSELLYGGWSTKFEFDSLSALGQPQVAFEKLRVMIRGSVEERDYVSAKNAAIARRKSMLDAAPSLLVGVWKDKSLTVEFTEDRNYRWESRPSKDAGMWSVEGDQIRCRQTLHNGSPRIGVIDFYLESIDEHTLILSKGANRVGKFTLNRVN